MKAIGYFRDSGQDGAPLAQQNKAFIEFCERSGHEVASTFVDDSDPGARSAGFRQLVAFLKQGADEFVVVVPNVEALGDELRDAARRFFQLQSLGARVITMDGAPDGAGAIVGAWTARDAGNKLSDRVRAAMRKKAVKGEVLGRPPYGYKVGNRRRLELVPEEAVVVRYIFRLYLNENMGIRLIARRLNEQGLKTRRGGNWSMVSIRDILRNRAYLGTYSRFGVRVPGSHPSLVSPEDFHLVQDRLNARRTSYAPRVPSLFLLSGIAFCGHCGNKLIGVSRKQTWKRRDGAQMSNSYRYYQCESRTNQSLCGYHTRRALELEAEVRQKLADIYNLGVAFPQPEDETVVLAEREHERERLRARLRAIDRRLEGYVESTAKGRLSRETMQTKSLSAASDRLVLEDALDMAESRASEQTSGPDRKQARERDLANLVDSWDELPFARRQAALREAVERISVTDDQIRLTLRP